MESSGTVLRMDQELLVCILAVWTAHPSFGYRRISHYVRQVLTAGTVKRIRKIMHASGLQAVFPGPEHQQGEQEELQVPLPVAQQADLVAESGLEYRRYLVAAACGGDVSGGDHRPVYEESLVLETEQHAGCLILRRMPARGSGCIWRAGNIP